MEQNKMTTETQQISKLNYGDPSGVKQRIAQAMSTGNNELAIGILKTYEHKRYEGFNDRYWCDNNQCLNIDLEHAYVNRELSDLVREHKMSGVSQDIVRWENESLDIYLGVLLAYKEDLEAGEIVREHSSKYPSETLRKMLVTLDDHFALNEYKLSPNAKKALAEFGLELAEDVSQYYKRGYLSPRDMGTFDQITELRSYFAQKSKIYSEQKRKKELMGGLGVKDSADLHHRLNAVRKKAKVTSIQPWYLRLFQLFKTPD